MPRSEEVYVLKLRIKYTKTGVLRFISHLDVMRYFQKAVRRAKLDISYSKGFSPHQLISFAAPMPLGMTSLGEYCDADFESVTDTEDMMRRFNCVSTPDLVIKDIVLLPDGAKNSMSVVAASDYLIELSEEGKKCPENFKLFEEALKLSEDENLMILKKTKKSETYMDIKPLIYEMEHRVYNHDYTEHTVPFSNKENTECHEGLYMMLAAGSVNNLKPDLVIEALLSKAGMAYDRFNYKIMRLETYMEDEKGLVPLSSAGQRI